MKFLMLLSLYLILALSAFAQEDRERYWDNGVRHSNWYIGKGLDDEAEKLKLRWSEIGESLNTTANPYAGTYHQYGDMSGFFLRWSPEKGFAFAHYYDQNLILDFSYGKVTVTDSEIIFQPEREMQREWRGWKPKTPTVWIPAAHGKILLTERELTEFGKYYGGYEEFNGFPHQWNCACAPFAEREGSIYPKDNKLPLIPLKYRRFIKNPISAQVVSVGKRRIVNEHPLVITVNEKVSLTPIKLNVGRKHGIKRGLLFLLINNGDNSSQFLEVKRVGEKSSQGLIVRKLNEKGNEVFFDYEENLKEMVEKAQPPIKVGIKVTTSPFLAN